MTKTDFEAEVKNITNQIVKKYKPEKIILFGSAARGKFGPDSDLDFLVVKNDGRTKIERAQTIYSLVEKKVPADFIVYTPQEIKERLKLGDPFLKIIFKEGRILYG